MFTVIFHPSNLLKIMQTQMFLGAHAMNFPNSLKYDFSTCSPKTRQRCIYVPNPLGPLHLPFPVAFLPQAQCACVVQALKFFCFLQTPGLKGSSEVEIQVSRFRLRLVIGLSWFGYGFGLGALVACCCHASAAHTHTPVHTQSEHRYAQWEWYF